MKATAPHVHLNEGSALPFQLVFSVGLVDAYQWWASNVCKTAHPDLHPLTGPWVRGCQERFLSGVPGNFGVSPLPPREPSPSLAEYIRASDATSGTVRTQLDEDGRAAMKRLLGEAMGTEGAMPS